MFLFHSVSICFRKIPKTIPNSLTADFSGRGKRTLRGGGGGDDYEVRTIHHIVVLPMAIFPLRGEGVDRGKNHSLTA